MSRRRGLTLVAAVAAGAVIAAGASQAQDEGQDGGSIGGGPPPPPPRADPAAGRPAYVAGWEEERTLLLDRAGRVVRVLPASAGASGRACPGGSRLADGIEWSGEVHVRRLDGKVLWRRRIPYGQTHNLECLDPRGRRVAVVTEPERRPEKTLRIVSRRGSRVVMRYRTESPLMTAERLYVTHPGGVKTYAIPSGRLVQDLAAPASAHLVVPSPDGRWLALTHLTDSLQFRSFLADTVTGEVRPIEIPRMWIVGWVADDRLAVRSDRRLRILDTSLREVQVVEGFRPLSAIVTRRGDLVAADGRALVRLRRGAGRVERIGTVPKDAWLVESLR